MTYQVLARKWRPRNFSEIVGQEHVVKSLINALQHERLHHAYLFTGTRGVGKTTLARILAKAINCENLQGYNPCGNCAVCVAVDQGRFLDLIEVDAASRTKVEDTRELLENAQYAPNMGRYKVYLIDEVHMLSGHSFNALLKTLEEPPPHVKFLLATTDPHKIPVTVLSRCLQYNLKRMQPGQIFEQMQFILQQEAIEAEPSALQLLAEAADGSMRDGLSLLDQAIVYGSGGIQRSDVEAMLGTVAERPVCDILSALAQNDAALLLQTVSDMADLSPDFNEVLQQLLQLLHKMALYQAAPTALRHEFDADRIINLASQLSPEDIQLYYQIALLGQRDLEWAPDPRSGFEMTLLRMLAFRPTAPGSAVSEPQQAPIAVNKTSPGLASVSSTKLSATPPVPVAPGNSDNEPWRAMIAAMKLGGMTRELANNCVLENIDDKVCTLILDPAHKQLSSARTTERLQKALQDYRGKPLKLTINSDKTLVETPALQLQQEQEVRQQAAVAAINDNADVQLLKERFDARILPGTIEPIDKQD
ncbi:MAG: DNA polymerase III subunit gamma/tau [Gammaproteobacteria bacterium HGW-Gammaproteobacteria-3]|nr:MAG: DNA polymerase III subunit gamma/tau [Gammaproteobacteria bacterium HGW-Gammaproteobacteria-3]